MDTAPTWSVTIDAPVEKVWPLVGDLNQHSEWSPKPYSVTWLSGEPNAVGSTFRSVGWLPQEKEHTMEGSVTANEPMRAFEVVTHDEKQEWRNRYELAPSGTGTVVTKTMQGPPLSGVRKAAFAFISAVFIKGAVQKGMNMLKLKAEAG
jgi:uncharacterized protein YndB with AHSA1/START domain